MSIESAPLHTIRMSTQDWNELLVTAINAGYKNRTEYMRAALKGSKPWYGEQLPNDSDNSMVRILARAEAAEKEVTQLRAELQAAKNVPPVLENPQSPPPASRGIKEIVAEMPEKTRAKWDAEKWKAETWVKYFLDHK